jgi:probable F420-dependent oxidoreductase
MKFSYQPSMCNPAFYRDLAKAVEAAGFDTFTTPDSICYPQQADNNYPYNGDGSREFLDGVPFIEAFSLVPWMAAVTTTLRFSTSVMKLPIRHPVLVAKSLTSVAVLTDNRFDFGVGLSPWPEDFEVCGQPWEGRGKRMDEMIEIIYGLCSGDYFGYDGEFYQLRPIKITPTPTKPVPILIGGHADVALQRAARLCDGWISAGGGIEELTVAVGKLQTYRQQFGRAHLPFAIQAMGADSFSVDGIRRLTDLGVSETIVGFRNSYAGGPDQRTLAQMIDEINHYADNIIHKTRA